MNTLRNKLTAIGVAGAVGVATFAIPSVPAFAAPVAPSQNVLKQSAPTQTEDVQWRRRHYGPAVALGVFGLAAGAIAADRYYRHGYYHRPYYPAYYGYGPRYYGPGPGYYGYGPRYYYGW